MDMFYPSGPSMNYKHIYITVFNTLLKNRPTCYELHLVEQLAGLTLLKIWLLNFIVGQPFTILFLCVVKLKSFSFKL